MGQRREREMKWKKMKNGKLHAEEEEGIEPLKVSLGGWLFNRSKGNLWDPKEEVPVVPFPVSCESGPHPIISKGVSSLVIRAFLVRSRASCHPPILLP